ncbi:MAG TPA: tetratricopeptide repeat protein, partial [Cyclobacteriaceae bacterium]|nr:tetratricopeptide repeat protein [Cyclobacteriaceae bacterium]
MNKDSLLALLPTAKNDTNKVFLYINIGQQYESNQPDSAKYFYLKARDLSNELDFTLGKIKFINNFTYVLDMQEMYDSSLQLNLESITLAQKLNNSKMLAGAYGNTGASLQRMERMDEAVQYYIKSLRYAEKANDKIYLSILNNNLSALYNTLGHYDKALAHADKAVQYARETNRPFNLGQALNNRGSILTNLKRPKEAIKQFEEAVTITQKIGDDFSYAAVLLGLGTLYLESGQYEKFRKCSEEGLRISKKLEDREGEAISLRGLGLYYLSLNDFSKSKQFASESFKVSSEAGNKTEIYKALQLLADNALAEHDVVKMRQYRTKADSVENLLQQESLSEKISEYSIKYETEKKDAELKLHKATIARKNALSYILFGSLVALTIIGILGFRNYSHQRKLQRQRISELEVEKQLLATEAVLKGEETERGRLAKDLHDGLGGMLSSIKYSFSTIKGNLVMTPENQLMFERSLNLLDGSIKEMRRVAHNMMPEALVNSGLNVALNNYCSEINHTGALALRYQAIGLEDIVIDQTTAIAIYRI